MHKEMSFSSQLLKGGGRMPSFLTCLEVHHVRISRLQYRNVQIYNVASTAMSFAEASVLDEDTASAVNTIWPRVLHKGPRILKQ